MFYRMFLAVPGILAWFALAADQLGFGRAIVNALAVTGVILIFSLLSVAVAKLLKKPKTI